MKSLKKKTVSNDPIQIFASGAAVIHDHYKGKKLVKVVNVWKKIGRRYLTNCSFCGQRFELKKPERV